MCHQKGRSILELVFTQAMRAEAARYDTEPIVTGAVLWDLSNVYEHLNRDKLQDRARDLGFPADITGVCRAQYGVHRIVVLGDLAARVPATERGVPAGCGFATYHVQVYGFSAYGVWGEAHP